MQKSWLLLFFVTVSLHTYSAHADIQELKIGFLQELTGPVATLGATCGRGADVAMRSFAADGKINQTPVKLVVTDVHNDAKVSVSEFQRMVETEGVQAVISVRSLSAMPISPLSVKKQIPLIGIVGASTFTSQNPYAVRVYSSPDKEAAFQVGIAKRLGKSRAAIIAVEDEFTLALAAGVEKEFTAAGGEIVSKISLLPSDSDFSTVLANIQAKHVDVVFAYLLTKSGLFVRKAQEAQLDSRIITNYWIQSPDQIEAAGNNALSRIVFSEVNSDKPLFKASYTATFPNEVYNPAAYLCYSAVGTVLQAAKKPGAFSNADTLRDALTNFEKIDLLDGPLEFRQREVQFDLVAKTFSEGKVVRFEGS